MGLGTRLSGHLFKTLYFIKWYFAVAMVSVAYSYPSPYEKEMAQTTCSAYDANRNSKFIILGCNSTKKIKLLKFIHYVISRLT